MKNLFKLTLVCLLTLPILSCGGKDDDGDINCGSTFNINQEISNELTALTNAATAFSADPTTANCNSYVAAAQDYLDAIEALENCAFQAGQQAEFQQAVQDAQDSINAIAC